MTAMLWAAVALACIAACFCAPPLTTRASESAEVVYVNVWAVQLEGGNKEADILAKRHNFINKGPVSLLI